MAQPGVRPYFNPGLAVLPLNLLRNGSANTSLSALVDVTKWLKGVTYTQEANIGDATAVGDRSMGKSTGKPDNGNLDVEIMRSYSGGGPMSLIQNFVSYQALCIWTDDTGTDAEISSSTDSLLRLAVCYITGVVHTDGNVRNADASSMSMSWPIDGDVYSLVTKATGTLDQDSYLSFDAHILSLIHI